MSLDEQVSELESFGSVMVDRDGRVTVLDCSGTNCTCRDVAALAIAHAITLLSAELRKTIERPGGGDVVVD